MGGPAYHLNSGSERKPCTQPGWRSYVHGKSIKIRGMVVIVVQLIFYPISYSRAKANQSKGVSLPPPVASYSQTEIDLGIVASFWSHLQGLKCIVGGQGESLRCCEVGCRGSFVVFVDFRSWMCRNGGC